MYNWESAYPKDSCKPVTNVSKGQTDIAYKGELQTLTKLSMRHQICPSETCYTTISESTITIPMSKGSSNCEVYIINFLHNIGSICFTN